MVTSLLLALGRCAPPLDPVAEPLALPCTIADFVAVSATSSVSIGAREFVDDEDELKAGAVPPEANSEDAAVVALLSPLAAPVAALELLSRCSLSRDVSRRFADDVSTSTQSHDHG